MVDQRKQAVSIRLGGSDLRNVKRLANRLGVRDSDIIRYAIKGALRRLAPLCDDAIRGKNLVPVLVEAGEDLIRHFDFDAYRLESIVNFQTEPESRVDRDDIALLAMSGLREQYLVMRMRDGHALPVEEAGIDRSLRNYLYDKYIFKNEAVPASAPARTSRSDDLESRATERPAA